MQEKLNRRPDGHAKRLFEDQQIAVAGNAEFRACSQGAGQVAVVLAVTMQLKMGRATVPVAALGVAPTAPGAPGRHPMGLDLGREMFSTRGRKLRARRPRSPKHLNRSGLAL